MTNGKGWIEKRVAARTEETPFERRRKTTDGFCTLWPTQLCRLSPAFSIVSFLTVRDLFILIDIGNSNLLESGENANFSLVNYCFAQAFVFVFFVMSFWPLRSPAASWMSGRNSEKGGGGGVSRFLPLSPSDSGSGTSRSWCSIVPKVIAPLLLIIVCLLLVSHSRNIASHYDRKYIAQFSIQVKIYKNQGSIISLCGVSSTKCSGKLVEYERRHFSSWILMYKKETDYKTFDGFFPTDCASLLDWRILKTVWYAFPLWKMKWRWFSLCKIKKVLHIHYDYLRSSWASW